MEVARGLCVNHEGKVILHARGKGHEGKETSTQQVLGVKNLKQVRTCVGNNELTHDAATCKDRMRIMKESFHPDGTFSPFLSMFPWHVTAHYNYFLG